GVLPEQIQLDYSQDRLAQLGLSPAAIGNAISARNITFPGGIAEAGGKNFIVDPSGGLKSEGEIGDLAAGLSSSGAPIYLRDVVDISRSYQNPARFLNYLTVNGQRSRAITLAVQMRPGEQIGKFGREIDARLATVRKLLPDDLILRRTSDQPLQV